MTKLKLAWLKAPVNWPGNWIEKRDEIIEKCEINKSTFYDWLTYPERIREAHRFIICQVFNKSYTELFN